MTGVISVSQKIFEQVMPTLEKKHSFINQLFLEAKNYADIAEEELQLGIEAIMLGARHKNSQLNIIAEWHFRRCQTKANLAQEKLFEVQDLKISLRQSEYCRLKIQKMDDLTVRCSELLRKLSRKNRTEIQTAEN
jgi:Zn finger protein HypA/HybF involved in hydrogenase expression